MFQTVVRKVWKKCKWCKADVYHKDDTHCEVCLEKKSHCEECGGLCLDDVCWCFDSCKKETRVTKKGDIVKHIRIGYVCNVVQEHLKNVFLDWSEKEWEKDRRELWK